MPGGLLRHGPQRGDLREMRDPTGRGEHGQAPRGDRRLDGPFFPLAPHALDRQLRIAVDHAPAEGGGLGRQHQVEARRELHAAQDPQRILRERGAGVSQHPGAQVGAAVVRIEDCAGERIVGDRVDREVAPRRRLGRGQRGIRSHGETAMAGTGLRFAPREAEVVLGAADAQLHHAETPPDQVGRAERRQDADQGLVIGARHLDVEILGIESEQPVAHAAAHEPRPPDGAHRGQDREQFSGQAHRKIGAHRQEEFCPNIPP